MAEIREVIYQHSQGRSQRKISESLGMSRLTIRKYIRLAQGIRPEPWCKNLDVNREGESY